ncbi:MAG: hypothetical protein N2C14_33160, partial [Planctomycetales bacterium]
ETLQNLWSLDLSYTRVSDKGVARFPSSLREVVLIGAPVTDAAFDEFERLKSLEYLNLSETQVSEEAALDFQRRMHVTVSW